MANKRVLLSNTEATALGFELNKKQKGKKKARYALRKKDIVELQELRNKGVLDSCNNLEVDATTVKHLWKKDKGASVFVKNPLYVNLEDQKSIDEVKILHDNFIKEVKNYSFKYPEFKREVIKDPHCLVFDAADIHIGKICSSFEAGEDYNSQIAVKRVKEGLLGIINKSKGYEIDKVIFVAGNDILHVDNAKSTTTSGTSQDTDGMWYDNYMIAKRLLVDVIETLLTIADVEVVYNPSNHDFTHGFMLLDSISSWFNKCDEVTFNNNMSHRKYTKYGKNLIGTTHMDSAKVDKLHGLMAEEASEFWHECKHRYIYGHHVHHTSAKDVFSVCIETLRSPSGTDSWHHRNGFQHSPKAVQGFIHHKEFGQVAKITHIF
jgi:hypothetical protein